MNQMNPFVETCAFNGCNGYASFNVEDEIYPKYCTRHSCNYGYMYDLPVYRLPGFFLYAYETTHSSFTDTIKDYTYTNLFEYYINLHNMDKERIYANWKKMTYMDRDIWTDDWRTLNGFRKFHNYT